MPCGAAARAFQRSFLALWPARVCLALYAALLMASQPLALDLPARKISSSKVQAHAAAAAAGASSSSSLGFSSSSSSSLMTWAAAGGACRLHSTLALGCALPLLLFTAASMLAAPLASSSSGSLSKTNNGNGSGKANQNKANAPLSATATLAVAALAAAPAAAAQAALAWAPKVPVEKSHRHYSWRNAALGICEPGTGGIHAETSPCGCRYSLAQLAALSATAAVGSLMLARSAGAAASAALNRRLASRLRVVQGAGSLLFLLYAALAAATRLSPPDRWPTEVARGATAAAAAAASGVLVVCLVLAPVAAASAARRAEERRTAAQGVEGGRGGGNGGGGDGGEVRQQRQQR